MLGCQTGRESETKGVVMSLGSLDLGFIALYLGCNILLVYFVCLSSVKQGEKFCFITFVIYISCHANACFGTFSYKL